MAQLIPVRTKGLTYAEAKQEMIAVRTGKRRRTLEVPPINVTNFKHYKKGSHSFEIPQPRKGQEFLTLKTPPKTSQVWLELVLVARFFSKKKLPSSIENFSM